jgi:hypothetical protein
VLLAALAASGAGARLAASDCRLVFELGFWHWVRVLARGLVFWLWSGLLVVVGFAGACLLEHSTPPSGDSVLQASPRRSMLRTLFGLAWGVCECAGRHVVSSMLQRCRCHTGSDTPAAASTTAAVCDVGACWLEHSTPPRVTVSCKLRSGVACFGHCLCWAGGVCVGAGRHVATMVYICW